MKSLNSLLHLILLMKNLILIVTITLSSIAAFGQTRTIPSVDLVDIDGNTFNTLEILNEGKPILINFWATWCPPCIEELPLIDAFYAANQAKSFQVVGLAVDQPSMVRRYLTQKPLRFPNGLAGFTGTALGQSLGNAQSVLPYSVLFAANGRLLKQKAGKLEQSDLNAWLQLVT